MRNNRQRSLIKAIISNKQKNPTVSVASETYSIVLGTEIIKIPKAFPEYRSKEELLQDNNALVFAEMNLENLNWLSSLATKVMEIGQDYRYSFFDSSLDFINPGLSGFRIYSENNDCVHVQVRRLPVPHHPEMFILDYFEAIDTDNSENADSCSDTADNTEEIECILSITCDLSKPKLAEVDIINSKNLKISEAWDYAYRIGGLFRYIMIYMRPWQYDVKNKLCTVEPIFELKVKEWTA